MDNETVGRLYNEKREAEAEVTRLTAALKKDGEFLQRLGNGLTRQPEDVVFSNAPGDLGSFGLEQLRIHDSLNWNEFPELERIARNIQALRAAKKKIQNAEAHLR